MTWIVDHLVAMEPAATLPNVDPLLLRAAAEAHLSDEYEGLWPTAEHLDDEVREMLVRLACEHPVIAGHLLPEDYV